jgi:hypothetical protein
VVELEVAHTVVELEVAHTVVRPEVVRPEAVWFEEVEVLLSDLQPHPSQQQLLPALLYPEHFQQFDVPWTDRQSVLPLFEERSQEDTYLQRML